MFGRGLASGHCPASFADLSPEEMYRAGRRDGSGLASAWAGSSAPSRAYPPDDAFVEPPAVRLARRLGDEAALALVTRFLGEKERIQEAREGAPAPADVEIRGRVYWTKYQQLSNRFMLLADAYHAGNLAVRWSDGGPEPVWHGALEPLAAPQDLLADVLPGSTSGYAGCSGSPDESSEQVSASRSWRQRTSHGPGRPNDPTRIVVGSRHEGDMEL